MGSSVWKLRCNRERERETSAANIEMIESTQLRTIPTKSAFNEKTALKSTDPFGSYGATDKYTDRQRLQTLKSPN